MHCKDKRQEHGHMLHYWLTQQYNVHTASEDCGHSMTDASTVPESCTVGLLVFTELLLDSEISLEHYHSCIVTFVGTLSGGQPLWEGGGGCWLLMASSKSLHCQLTPT